MTRKNLLGVTESVCPVCLQRIKAEKIEVQDEVYLIKSCEKHGEFRVLIWQGEPCYQEWENPKVPAAPNVCLTEVERGCPYDCGLCPDHRQDTCCVLLEVTARCNLACPVCFARAAEEDSADPGLEEIESWFRLLIKNGGPYNIQLSGGEPTLRDDLPAIIKMGRDLGFSYIQVNSNGLRLARENGFAKLLKEAGLSCVFLQFDGTLDRIYEQIRGRKLLELKKQAISACAAEGIGVVLVPTLVPGINMDNIGEIIEFAIAAMPWVRGVHFQPVSYFGRYPFAPPVKRITIPHILRAIEVQSGGRLKADNFLPAGAENSYCSFHGNFILQQDGTLKPWSSFSASKDAQSKCCCQPLSAAEGLKKGREFVARQWSGPQKEMLLENHSAGSCGCDTKSLDEFLLRAANFTLAISGMAFQDAWTLDLERLRECKVHVMSPEKRIIPFCAYNLTAKDGTSLYRP